MHLDGLLQALARDPTFDRAIAAARSRETLTAVGPGGARALLAAFAAAPNWGDAPVLAVTASTREAEDLAAELAAMLPADSVAEFPAWETLPHERLSPTHDVVGRRLKVLRRLAHPIHDGTVDGNGPIRVLVCGVRALLQPIAIGLGELEPVRATGGDQIDLDDMVRLLAGGGYQRTDLVTRRGEFAVRGGIVDVFPPTEEHPVRVEFFGDEVEHVRYFSVVDQRSLPGSATQLWAPPCRELLITARVRQRAAQLMTSHPELADILGPVSEGIHVEGMESLAPVLSDGMTTLPQLIEPGSIVLVLDPARIGIRAHELVRTSDEFLAAGWHASAVGGVAPIDLARASFRTVAQTRQTAADLGMPWWELTPFTAPEAASALEGEADDPDGVAEAGATTLITPPQFRGNRAALIEVIKARMQAHSSVLISAVGHGTAARFAEQLRGDDLPCALVDELSDPPSRDVVTVTTSPLRLGLDVPASGLLLLTETELTGRSGTASSEVTRLPSRRRRGVDPLQLKPGDHVVHEQHGVGRFVELSQRTVAGATREYLVLEYAASKRGQPPDKLFVPTDQLDLVTRYIGGEAPSVHRLGGSDWQQQKGRARKAVRQIADELVRLYAVRQAAVGHCFGPDTPWQAEMEDAFPFAETPDQLSCIDEVKADMERPVPMDRLICGDVGYGKTEIAIRAAFKAVQDGTQVAVLVPTTLLVRQHFETFTERFAAFPIKVAALSRFQNAAETKSVLAGITDGTVDVVIATHRLLSPDTRFKNLGLVIVDEEQRFGVEHKEHLKALRANVDVLSMSATPIPRTLEMAVTGIRELSTIQTPPEQRLPVLTFVGPYEERQVGAAIRRELLRDGQVFFLHNRVASIDRAAAKVRELVPGANVAVAHGQMGESALERVMVDFWERRIDVLVCTTIVESGLDITNANTMIIDRAERYGLSQLHQLRGRVGRGRERAYAYFLYQPDATMTEAAHERLTTIAQNTDLGSGMAVAMKDLEIRGAGNLLGGEQSGHIADVGFDLYVRLVGEALAEAKGTTDGEQSDVRIELPLDAHIPDDYVPSERLRLEAYKRIASVTDEADIVAAAAELADRFGPLPPPVSLLLDVARLRLTARSTGVREIIQAGTRVRLGPVELPESRALRLTRLFPGSLIKPVTRTILVPLPMTARVGGTPLSGEALLAWTTGLIEAVLLPQTMNAKEAG